MKQLNHNTYNTSQGYTNKYHCSFWGFLVSNTHYNTPFSSPGYRPELYNQKVSEKACLSF